MSNLSVHDTAALLDKIEYNAKQFENIPDEILTEDFIIKAIQRNSLTTRFLKEKDINNDKIAFVIAFTVSNHKNIINHKLNEDDFYFNYICQKIKNNELSNKQTYINTLYLSKEDNVMKIINAVGFFKLKYLSNELRDKETIVDMFCNYQKVNQIWASKRIKEEASFSGIEVSQYIKTKLFYERLDAKFAPKQEIKVIKI